MNKKILCFGELLVDMISTTTGDLIASDGFLKKFGGAPANTAMGLAKLGNTVSFMGKVGNDPFGHFLKQTLEENHVDTHALMMSDEFRTTLAFVALEENGERDFSFYRGAHEKISPEEIEIQQDIDLLHFGSVTQTNENAHQATLKLISEARKKDVIISYDPNIRESLWDSMDHAKEIILQTSQLVDILRLNLGEALTLSGKETVEEAAEVLFTDNLDAFFVTNSADGCYYKTKTMEGHIPTIKVQAVDTTGAGDAFNAGYNDARIKSGKNFSDMSKEEIEKHLKRATVIGSLTTTKKGSITAFPTEEEIINVLI
jgi:fructokinase